ncbi:MAG: radical SAM protein [Clostridia bacterium]|nr:radical SAM protein [Clostridia bacterium]
MGFCQTTQTATVTRAAPHMWEEPCISGTNGSGAVFFAGCNLGCIYCQNAQISRNGQVGQAVTPQELRQIFLQLKDQGVHNINLVTPTHLSHVIGQALATPIGLPVVYNCGGYESICALRSLEGKIQIYLPDLKYVDPDLAKAYSSAPDYPTHAKQAILEMYRQVGNCQFDQQGLLQKGVLIRHMILPGHTKNTLAVIDWVANTFPKDGVLFSLMSQYTPMPAVAGHKPLGRKVTQREFEKCRDALFDSGIENGFIQEPTSANSCFIPPFDLTNEP